MAEKAGSGRRGKAKLTVVPPPTTTATGDGREVSPADNERAVYEAEKAQLLNIVTQIMAQQRVVVSAKAKFDEELAIIKAPLDDAKARELELFRLGKAATFSRKELEARIDEMKTDTRQREEQRKREQRHRGMLNIGGQGDLFDDALPMEERDALYWQSEGYGAYHRGEPCQAPAECPQRFVQAVLQGWNDAQTATIWAMGKAGEEPPAAAAEPEPEPDLSPAELKAQEKRARASLDNMGEEMLDAIAEVEPDLVAQVREDYEDA